MPQARCKRAPVKNLLKCLPGVRERAFVEINLRFCLDEFVADAAVKAAVCLCDGHKQRFWCLALHISHTLTAKPP